MLAAVEAMALECILVREWVLERALGRVLGRALEPALGLGRARELGWAQGGLSVKARACPRGVSALAIPLLDAPPPFVSQAVCLECRPLKARSPVPQDQTHSGAGWTWPHGHLRPTVEVRTPRQGPLGTHPRRLLPLHILPRLSGLALLQCGSCSPVPLPLDSW